MGKMWRQKHGAVGRATARIMLVTGLAGLCVIGSTSVAGAAGPAPLAKASGGSSGVANYKNALAKNTNGWCPAGTGNAPCDGKSGDYGTIDIVNQSFSNDGGYAPSAPAPGAPNKKTYARVSGGEDGGVEGVNGCSEPGGENCSGPYTLFGSNGEDATFPKYGIDTSIKIYLDSNWANENPGQVIDWDVSLNNNSGSFLEDNVFNLCTTSNDGGGFYVSTSFGAGGCSTGPTEITASGWYTFQIEFDPIDGNVWDTFGIQNSSGGGVFAQVVDTGNAVASVGGPNYGWFPDEDALGLPIAQVSLVAPTKM